MNDANSGPTGVPSAALLTDAGGAALLADAPRPALLGDVPRPALLGVDWGTSSLRGALLDAHGAVLAEHTDTRGLLTLPAGGWAAVFEASFGHWMRQWPTLKCLMAGMVGSRQGWVEAPYCACPASLHDLAARLCWVQPGRVAIVPGLCVEHPGRPDVMRGEETQIFGALQLLGLQAQVQTTLLLPGTHSKWVQVRQGRIVDFTTHMSGECYALFRRHSILARGLPDSAAGADEPLVESAFDDAVARAQQPGGLLQHLFGVRTLALFDRMAVDALASHLSGLVIGEELRAQGVAASSQVVLIGASGLTARYARALAQLGVQSQTIGAQASWSGLARLAATMAA